MKYERLKTQIGIYPLLFLSFLFYSCPEQVKTNFPIKKLAVRKTKKKPGNCPYQNISSSLKDKDGNLWFGSTGEGVFLFDGKSFTHYTEKDGLSSNEISCIYEDRDGNLMFGTNNGISRFDAFASLSTGSKRFSTLRIPEPKDRNFQDYKTTPNDIPFTINMISSIVQDKTGDYWFATNVGVFRYNGKSFSYFLHNDGIVNKNKLHLKQVSSILEDKNGVVWFASYNQEGLCRFDGKSISSFTPCNDGMILSILEAKSGNIWIGTKNHGACLYDGKSLNNYPIKDGLCNNNVTTILEDRKGNIWFGSDGKDGGATCYDGKSFTCFTIKDGLSNNSLWTIVEDNSGKLWFGTRGMGLYCYDGVRFIDYSKELIY
ncbi:MAG TPA: two-component regulator propeller domain-containing protein [Saprospiraceae bacterium]|nr:two-component regulator propeller domain-containing protein [Saprospiraceae bacterium]